MSDLNHFMKYRNINTSLRMRIRRYFEFIHEEEKMGNQRGKKLIPSLNCHLKDELKYDAYIKYINESKILKNNFSQEFIKQICLIYKECTFAPEEIIFNVLFFLLFLLIIYN